MEEDSVWMHLQTLEALPGHRFDLVAEYARKVLRIEPDNEYGWRYLVHAYTHSQEFVPWLDDLRQAFRLFPESPWVYENLGDYYFYHCRSDCYFIALQVYQHVLQDCPMNYRALAQIGEIYLINWEPDKAAFWFEKACRYAPEYPRIQSRLALAQLRCRKFELAMSLARNALSRKPECEFNVVNCGMVFLYGGNLDEAETLCRRAMAELPNYDYFARQLNTCLREKDDRANRERKGLRYTPLVLRQRGTQKNFNEEMQTIKFDPSKSELYNQKVPTPWELFPGWKLPGREAAEKFAAQHRRLAR